jgi:hypothetical protein
MHNVNGLARIQFFNLPRALRAPCRQSRRPEFAGFSGCNAAEAAGDPARDPEKRTSFYAEDGGRFAAGSPDIRGTAALRNEWQKYLSAAGTFQ